MCTCSFYYSIILLRFFLTSSLSLKNLKIKNFKNNLRFLLKCIASVVTYLFKLDYTSLITSKFFIRNLINGKYIDIKKIIKYLNLRTKKNQKKIPQNKKNKMFQNYLLIFKQYLFFSFSINFFWFFFLFLNMITIFNYNRSEKFARSTSTI